MNISKALWNFQPWPRNTAVVASAKEARALADMVVSPHGQMQFEASH